MNQDEIFVGVCQCLSATLDVPADSIRFEDKIVEDLGADSLDLLDLSFHLEQKFKISLSPRDFERHSKENLGDAPLEIEGVYTPEGLRELQKMLPEIPPEELFEGLTTAEFPRVLRVGTMVNLVHKLLEEKSG